MIIALSLGRIYGKCTPPLVACAPARRPALVGRAAKRCQYLPENFRLRPFSWSCGKMTADQLSMLEKQYLERNLLEKSKIPRLSLFYMR